MHKDDAACIRVLLLDVDGVLTDGGIWMDKEGEEVKRFHVRDGLGVKLLLEAGIDVILISGRRSKAVEVRARALGIREVYQGVEDKSPLVERLVKEKGLKREEVCCVGDDLQDLAMFRHAGIPVAVANASPEVRKAARYITRLGGGKGAVREVCEWILKARNQWEPAISALDLSPK